VLKVIVFLSIVLPRNSNKYKEFFMPKNMLIAQSGGPTMVINQSLAGAVLAARKSKDIGTVLGARHGIQGILNRDFVNLSQISVPQMKAVAQTPSSALGSVRRKPTPQDCKSIFSVLDEQDVGYFFYIGGNDSAETVHIIHEAAMAAGSPLKCFHIPKTIDNDLRENDHTPGFASAARFVACAFMGDDLDSRALGGVKVNIVMGRHAGFLTAAAALARTSPGDGPHLIYLPERPFSLERFASDVQAMYKKHGRCVIAVSEGIADEKGEAIAARFSKEVDSHGNKQLSGTGSLGDFLASEIKARTGISRVRADTFGYLQRSFPGIASAVDAREAYEAGEAAVKAALQGLSSGSIAIRRKKGDTYGVNYEPVPLRKVAKETRHMPDSYINKAGNDVTAAFLRYITPLVGSLPKTARLL
jgi:ATP-dependent phosphofructokinase / diphosphate-dependent phosphofructokinase